MVIVAQGDYTSYLARRETTQTVRSFPIRRQQVRLESSLFPFPVGSISGKGRKTETEEDREGARLAVKEWARWRKKLVVAKEARAFSPSRSLIA